MRRADGGDGDFLVANVLPRHGFDGFNVHGVDASEHFGAGHASAVRQDLSAEFFRRGARAGFGVQQQGRLERLLGARQVVLLGAVDEVLELAHDGKCGVVETFEVVAGHVHAEQTGIGVVGVESHEGEGHCIVLRHALTHV